MNSFEKSRYFCPFAGHFNILIDFGHVGPFTTFNRFLMAIKWIHFPQNRLSKKKSTAKKPIRKKFYISLFHVSNPKWE